MANLETNTPEIQPTRLRGVLPRPAVANFNQLTRTLTRAGEANRDTQDNSKLAGLVMELTNTDQELQDAGLPPVGPQEEQALSDATTTERKLQALQKQRSNTRSGMTRRVAALRAFVAENPQLVTEGLSTFSAAVGRAPGAAIRELEADAIAGEMAELDAVAAFNQGIQDQYIELGGDITDSPQTQKEYVLAHRGKMAAKAQANADWETRKDRDLLSARETLEGYYSGRAGLITDQVISDYSQMEIPKDAQGKAAAIQELEQDYTQFIQNERRKAGPVVVTDPAWQMMTSAWEELRDLQIRRINGEDVDEQIKTTNSMLTGMAEMNFLQKGFHVNGRLVTGADLRQVVDLARNADFASLLKLRIAGSTDFADALNAAVGAVGFDADTYQHFVNQGMSASELATTVEGLHSTLRGIDKGVVAITEDQAVNLANSMTVGMRNGVPEEVMLSMTRILADDTITETLGLSNVFPNVTRPLANYVADTAEVLRGELGETVETSGLFSGSVAPMEVLNFAVSETPGGRVVVSITPKTDSPRNQEVADIVSRQHAERLRLLVNARMNYVGGTADEALQTLLAPEGNARLYLDPNAFQPETTEEVTTVNVID